MALKFQKLINIVVFEVFIKLPCTNRNLAKLIEESLQLQPPSTPTMECSFPSGQRSKTILTSRPYFPDCNYYKDCFK